MEEKIRKQIVITGQEHTKNTEHQERRFKEVNSVLELKRKLKKLQVQVITVLSELIFIQNQKQKRQILVLVEEKIRIQIKITDQELMMSTERQIKTLKVAILVLVKRKKFLKQQDLVITVLRKQIHLQNHTIILKLAN